MTELLNKEQVQVEEQIDATEPSMRERLRAAAISVAMTGAQKGSDKMYEAGSLAASSIKLMLGRVRSESVSAPVDEGAPRYIDPDEQAAREQAAYLKEWPNPIEGKTAHPLDLFAYSHIEDESFVVRNNGRRVIIFEVSGVEINHPTVAAFAGVLNSLPGHVQFLIRQHPPRLSQFRKEMLQRYEWVEDTMGMSPTLKEASESLDHFVAGLENRPGLMDRRFYIACEERYEDDVRAAMGRMRVEFGQVIGRALRILLQTVAYGQSPAELPTQQGIRMRITKNYVVSDNGHYRRTISVKVLPRIISDSFMESILMMGIPMDVAIHVIPISATQAQSTLQSQLTKMQANANSQLKRKGMVDEREQLAIQDLLRVRSAVLRGVERMFNTSLIITVHGDSLQKVNERITTLRSTLTSVMAQVDEQPRLQGKALVGTAPLCDNRLSQWMMADTSTLALMFPFSPPDIDTRHGTLIGLDVQSNSLVTYDLFDNPFAPNMNTAILATSGAGKSFTAKLTILRQLTRGVKVYVIDPEGEYVDTAIAAGGRVMTPGVPGQGMNPFVVTETGAELMERAQNLVNLLQVMIGQRLDPNSVARLDNALTSYYRQARERDEQGNWSGLFNHIHQYEPDLAVLMSRFSTGSMCYLLSDEGNDLLVDESPITVFNLQVMQPKMRAAAALVCAETVWTMATRDPRPRMLVVDEVWSIIKDPEGAEFMMNSAKRARKHMLGLTSITQDVGDLLAENASEGVIGGAGKSLITNAAYQILLRQHPAVVETIGDVFALPPRMASRLASYPTGQGLLITPTGRCTIQIEASPAEAEIIKWQANGRE